MLSDFDIVLSQAKRYGKDTDEMIKYAWKAAAERCIEIVINYGEDHTLADIIRAEFLSDE